MCSDFDKLIIAKSGEDGKAWLPLWMHSRDTAGIMLHIWEEWLPEAVREGFRDVYPSAMRKDEFMLSMGKLCYGIGFLHDIGKATAVFAAKIAKSLDSEFTDRIKRHMDIPDFYKLSFASNCPHARNGEAVLRSLNFPECFAAIIGAHHGKPQEYSAVSEHLDTYAGLLYGGRIKGQKTKWEKAWKSLADNALEHMGYDSAKDIPVLEVKHQMILSGMLVMADWIASNNYYFPLLPIDEYGDENVYPVRVDDAWRRLNLAGPWTVNSADCIENIFEKRFGFAPNSVQNMVIEAVKNSNKPGIYILEAHMGMGKTEAALMLAEACAAKTGSGGIFFGLPTQATANGIFPRLLDWAEKFTEQESIKLSVVLAHAAAELNERYRALFSGEARVAEDEEGSGLIVQRWFKGRKQILLSDFVIGTVDQFLMSALQQKHLMLRHLGLAGKVVIIDECHAYDAYMSRYLDMALEWLGEYGAPVIILSATLTNRRREELIEAYLGAEKIKNLQESDGWRTSNAYPVLTWTDESGIRQHTADKTENDREVSLIWKKRGDIIQTVREGLENGGCAGIIMNTVADAQEIAAIAERELGDIKVVLLHSRFMTPDRANKEKELMDLIGRNSDKRSRDKVLVVGTQVIEQSLDIDLDLLVTELCPMDLLIQRIGRLHRHRAHDLIRPERLSKSVCCIIDIEPEMLEKSVYEKIILIHTKMLMPKKIMIPSSIPELIQRTYDFTELEADEDYGRYIIELNKQINKADVHKLYSPYENELLCDVYSGDNGIADEESAKAAVRDTEDSIEVIMLRNTGDSISFVPWQYGGREVPSNSVPSEEEAVEILSQSIKLPAAFSKPWVINSCFAALGEIKRKYFAEWEYSPVLQKEFIMLFDKNMEYIFTLNQNSGKDIKYRLKYSLERGLEYNKEDDDA